MIATHSETKTAEPSFCLLMLLRDELPLTITIYAELYTDKVQYIFV